MTKIAPNASKGFAIYSCFRETGNPTPSALIFVDPPAKDGVEPIELPNSWVRRRNYAAWLTFMGLPDAASGLRNMDRRVPSSVDLPVFQIGARLFAVSLVFRHPNGRWIGVGLDVRALDAIQAALADNEQPLLTSDAPFTDGVGIATPVPPNASVFPDGSFFGIVDGTMQYRRHRTFQL